MNISLASIGKLLRQHNIDEWDFLVRLAGDHHSAFVLRRIIIWTPNPKAQSRGGWFYKTHEQMSQETAGLSPYQIRKSQKQLQRLVQVKRKRINGKDVTWYRLKIRAFLRAVGALVSRYTGKTFNAMGENTHTQRESFDALTSKKLTRQSLTSYSNNQSHDNQTQTSNNQEPNQEPDTTPPALDDDLTHNLPDWLKGFSFTGECDVAAFVKEIERVGEVEAKKKFEETSKVGKSWLYHLNSLKNLDTPPTTADYSDVVNKPAQPQPAVDQSPAQSVPLFWQAIRQQFEMQFHRFDLSGSRCHIEGDQATITLTSDIHRLNIAKSDNHPRGITYWIAREIAKSTGTQPAIIYTIGA